jgi:uncharacterized protein
MPHSKPQPISADFQLMAKPIGPRCNLRCVYCFYRSKEHLFGTGEKWRMTGEVLEAYVRQYLACLRSRPEVMFAWQGGEPTLMGIDFYRRAVELQQHHKRPTQRVANSFQTNGILVNDEWCRFFHDAGFLVGLSLDGPPDVHDRWRVDPDGKPTSQRVIRALERLQSHQVEYNVLCSVQSANAAKPREVYRFFRDLGIRFLQFIPIVVPVPGASGAVSAQSVTAEAWGSFMCEVFDEWVRNDVGTVFVQSFDMALAAWMGYPAPLCTFSETCGRALVIEHNGDIFSCDHFVTAEHRLGNILERPLGDMVDSDQQLRFAADKRDRRPAACQECPYDFVCRGECPKNRLVPPPGETQPLNHLCEGFKRFFAHIDPYMRQMAAALRAGRPAAVVMEQFRGTTGTRPERPQRNTRRAREARGRP